MYPVIIYSHTDYLDILRIQVDHIGNLSNKILLINNSKVDIGEITSKFDRVIYYDDALPYASRLCALSELNDEVVLFLHDIDILVDVDIKVVDLLAALIKREGLDRIDLQYDPNYNENSNNRKINLDIENHNFTIVEQTSGYIYNVNPSLWRLSSLLKIMNHFPDSCYRSIEVNGVQSFCIEHRLKIYKLFSSVYLNCGYFRCLPFFTFLHITHCGGLLPLDSSRLEDKMREIYANLVYKYKLYNSNRKFNSH